MYKRGMTIAEVLAETILRLGITQDEAASRLGVKQPTVNRWLQGAHTPSATYVATLARFCSITERQAETAILLQQRRGAKTIQARVADLESELAEIRAEAVETRALLAETNRLLRGKASRAGSPRG